MTILISFVILGFTVCIRGESQFKQKISVILNLIANYGCSNLHHLATLLLRVKGVRVRPNTKNEYVSNDEMWKRATCNAFFLSFFLFLVRKNAHFFFKIFLGKMLMQNADFLLLFSLHFYPLFQLLCGSSFFFFQKIWKKKNLQVSKWVKETFKYLMHWKVNLKSTLSSETKLFSLFLFCFLFVCLFVSLFLFFVFVLSLFFVLFCF